MFKKVWRSTKKSNVLSAVLSSLVISKKLKLDPIKKKEVMKAENLATNSPLITGKTDSIQEDKGGSYLDSPGMRPTGRKDDSDMRKMAILRNAQARGAMEEVKSAGQPKSMPGSPKLGKTHAYAELIVIDSRKSAIIGEDAAEKLSKDRRSSFAKQKSEELEPKKSETKPSGFALVKPIVKSGADSKDNTPTRKKWVRLIL